MSSPIASPAQQQLTPRSKVAALLADIDNRSVSPSPIRSRSAIRDSIRLAKSSVAEANRKTNDESEREHEIETEDVPHQPNASPREEDDTEDDGPVLPKGKAARRMLGLAENTSAHGSSNIDDVDSDDLYTATSRKATRAMSRSPLGSKRGSGLFVSPARPEAQDSDEDELPSNPLTNRRLQELVAEKRAARLAREAEEQDRRTSSAHASSDLPDEVAESSQDPRDERVENIMSDAARPTRKASKRALLEMERETQRMSRQMALAHEMKVKKKFTTADFLAKFAPKKSLLPVQVGTGDSTASSALNSDGMEGVPKSTPPSSPPTPFDNQKQLVEKGALSKLTTGSMEDLHRMVDDEEELPDMDVLMSSTQARPAFSPTIVGSSPPKVLKGAKLARFGKKAVKKTEDSDDELEIMPSMPKHLAVFERLRHPKNSAAKDNKAIHILRHLAAQGHEPDKPGKKPRLPSIAPQQLERDLRRKARLQAQQERDERIAELRAKGIIVQTEEERQREAEVFEDLLEKARLEQMELKKKERAEDGNVEVSDDEDENSEPSEYGEGEGGEPVGNEMVVGEAEEDDDEEAGVELSGSEEEYLDEEIDEQIDDENVGAPIYADEAAVLPSTQSEGLSAPVRKGRKSRAVLDSDDEEDTETIHTHTHTPTPALPTHVQDDDPFAAFGFAKQVSSHLLSPTQAFRATMASATQDSQDQDSMDVFRQFAPPSVSSLLPTLPIESQAETQNTAVVPASQDVEVGGDELVFSYPSQLPETPSLQRDHSKLSETPGWEPSQDNGPANFTPSRLNATWQGPDADEDFETQETVRLRVSESPAPAAPANRGRLTRRAVMQDSESEVEAPAQPKKVDAFKEMRRRRELAMTETEKAEVNVEMRQMMDEAAEESDDEFAGLGGPQDDTHLIRPEDDDDRAMIDSSAVDVDERALARLYAEKQREREEQETSRLYKDLTTGALRRRQGALFDLDDEEDAAVRRRQMRQREEARKRRLLLQDDSLASLAQSKNKTGSEAFLRAIADDDGGDEDMLDLSEPEEPAETQESIQPSQQPAEVLQPTSGNKRKLNEGEETPDMRPPAKSRRTAPSTFRKPASLADIRNSVSELLDEPSQGFQGPTALELSSDSEADQNNEPSDNEEEAERQRQNDGGFAPNPIDMEAKAMPPPRLPASQRRSQPKAAVVDRLSLKRGNSSASDSTGAMAWGTSNKLTSFRAPSLLRRATTSTLASDAYAKPNPGLLRESSGGGTKMGGSKKSSLAYQARAEERKSIVEAGVRAREESRAKIAAMRRNSSMLGKGLAGRFE